MTNRLARFCGHSRMLLILAPVCLTSCAAENSSQPVASSVTRNACDLLPVKAYPIDQRRQVADEIDRAPPFTVWPSWVSDYGKLRAAVRACQDASK
jgi:hypothetical protein